MVAATRPNLKVSASRYVGRLPQQQQQQRQQTGNVDRGGEDREQQLTTEAQIKVNNKLTMLEKQRDSTLQEHDDDHVHQLNNKLNNNNDHSLASARNQSPPPPKDWQLEQKYTLSEVQQHASLDDCWMVIFDKVYNITDFVYEHPGGDYILLEYAGRDATHPFLSSRHGSSAYKMLDKYWIGILVDEELYYSNNSSYCSVYSNLSWRSTPTLEENII